MYKTKIQMIADKVFVQPGDNLVDIDVHNRVFTQLIENIDLLYKGNTNILDQVGINPGDATVVENIPEYFSTNYISKGMTIKRAIEVLDNSLYNIYNMSLSTITDSSTATGGIGGGGYIGGGGDSYQNLDYILKVSNDSFDRPIHTESADRLQICPFAIDTTYTKAIMLDTDAPVLRVHFGYDYRTDIGGIGGSGEGYIKELYSVDQGGTFSQYRDFDGKLRSIVSLGLEYDSHGRVSYTGIEDKEFWQGMATVGYTDKYGFNRLMFFGSLIDTTINTVGRYIYKEEASGAYRWIYRDAEDYLTPTLPSPAFATDMLINDLYTNYVTTTFLTNVSIDTAGGSPKMEVRSSTKASDGISGSSYTDIKSFTQKGSVATNMTGAEANRVTNFVFDNPGPVTNANQVMVWVYKDFTGNYVYRLGSSDGTGFSTSVARTFADDFFTLPDNIMGSPAALLLTNNRVLISYIYWEYSSSDGLYYPKVGAHLSYTGTTLWSSITYDIPATVLAPTSVLVSRRRKIALIQTPAGGGIYGFFVAEGAIAASGDPASPSRLSRVYKITFNIGVI